jgi:antitoxin HicB
MTNPHVASSFDEFLAEEGLLEEVEAVAIKRILARQVSEAMAAQSLTKKAMAERMGTSRSALDRLLDPDNTSVTLRTRQKAASTVGRRLRLELV